MKHLFCFGMGYSAQALARRLPDDEWTITGTARSQEGCKELEAAGYGCLLFDGGNTLEIPETVTHLLISIPPDAEGDVVLRHHRDKIAGLASNLNWAGYLSTTGVYGNRDGGWVDESSALEPTTERGRRRVEAERQWLSLFEETGLPLAIFRLAGIYGPGRNQLLSVAAGKARRIVKPGQVFSRIHVEDIASVLEASIAHPNPGAAYNVCDDEAAPPQDVVAYAAELLGQPAPSEIPFKEAEMSPMGRSFYAESKRVSNERIKSELGVPLKYPNYRVGLKALAADFGQ
ncbi:MAG: SDR family oxidoreductase [Hyphomicrobiales bacterium]